MLVRIKKLRDGVEGLGVNQNQNANGARLWCIFERQWDQIREIGGLGLERNWRSKAI